MRYLNLSLVAFLATFAGLSADEEAAVASEATEVSSDEAASVDQEKEQERDVTAAEQE